MPLEFIPTRVFYEPGALDYPLGKGFVERFQHMDGKRRIDGSWSVQQKN